MLDMGNIKNKIKLQQQKQKTKQNKIESLHYLKLTHLI